MSGYDTIVRNGVALANELTASLQVNVVLHPWIGINSQGGPVYGTSVTIPAVVEYADRLRKKMSGEVVQQRAVITFVRPIASTTATDRYNPIDPRDKIVLPNGYTGPILDVMGVIDPLTSAPYMLEVLLG